MKSFILAITMLLTLGLSTSFAKQPEPDVSPAVLAAFQKEFSFVKSASWTVGKDFTKAIFLHANSRIEAYFDNNGDFLGTSRNLLFDQLPLTVISSLQNKYGNTGAYEIVEHNGGGETNYFLTVETAKHKLKLKVDASGEITVLKKIKK